MKVAPVSVPDYATLGGIVMSNFSTVVEITCLAPQGSFKCLCCLLKVCVLEALLSREHVFIDCYDLQNREFVFDYVGNQSKTAVALEPRELLLVLWCLGELVTMH